jgi:phosphatidylserine/phosphatidylglycerophosphate/cardiolipin synthase-like enzyme
MAKKQSKGSPPRSLTATLLGIAVLVVAIIVFQLTGIDFLGVVGTLTVVPSEPPATAPPATQPPTTGATEIASAPSAVTAIEVGQGSGVAKDFWQVYFNAPTGSSDKSTYVDGIDVPLSNALANVQKTLDIAAFEFNNVVLEQAILDAKARGVQVRIVTDDEHGIGDEKDTAWEEFQKVGIPIVDDDRSGLMHNKFMILDSTTVWTGSWNYTVNGTYRNNNNALVLRSRRAVEAYQGEFDEMFDKKEFGPRSSTGNSVNFNQDGVPIQILFASEDEVAQAIDAALSEAKSSVKFLAFVFSLDATRELLIEKAGEGVEVTGIFEKRNSTADWSELPPLRCAGMDIRQDGNKYVLHHKLFIIDDTTVITGSFNFSDSASDKNDENVVIITEPDIAAQYVAEFERRWAEAVVPEDIECN